MRKHPELSKLKGRITERKETYRTLSKKTGIPLNTLSNKINGHVLFDIVEASKVCSALDIPPQEIPVFFSVNCETQSRTQF